MWLKEGVGRYASPVRVAAKRAPYSCEPNQSHGPEARSVLGSENALPERSEFRRFPKNVSTGDASGKAGRGSGSREQGARFAAGGQRRAAKQESARSGRYAKGVRAKFRNGASRFGKAAVLNFDLTPFACRAFANPIDCHAMTTCAPPLCKAITPIW